MSTQSTAGTRHRLGRSGTAAPASSPVSEETIFDLSEVFKMLSDRSRLKILFALARTDAMHVTALKSLLEESQGAMSQPAVSHHLALLRSAKLVRCDRHGKQCFYRLDTAKLGGLLDQLFSEMGNSNRQIQFEDLALSLKRR